MSPLLILAVALLALVIALYVVAVQLGILRPPLAGAANQGDAFPYSRCDAFLSQGELAFYRELLAAVAGRYTVMAKVRLIDLLVVTASGKARGSALNRVIKKHVDFVLCEPTTMWPFVVIELDDASHGRRDRQDRDAFVQGALAAAGLPLLSVRAAASYDAGQLAQRIEVAIGPAATGRLCGGAI